MAQLKPQLMVLLVQDTWILILVVIEPWVLDQLMKEPQSVVVLATELLIHDQCLIKSRAVNCEL